MIVYHRTRHAEAILRDGFRNVTRRQMADVQFTGVWFSDVPPNCNKGAEGDTVLAVHVPHQVFAEFEWSEDCKPCREAYIPADLLSFCGEPWVHDSPTTADG